MSHHSSLRPAAAGFLLLAAALVPAAAHAQSYPWCAAYTDGDTNCSFESLEQCRMTATPGSGSRCQPNALYKPPPPEPEAAPPAPPAPAVPPKRSKGKPSSTAAQPVH